MKRGEKTGWSHVSPHIILESLSEREREASEAFYTRETTPSTKLPSMEDVLRCFYY